MTAMNEKRDYLLMQLRQWLESHGYMPAQAAQRRSGVVEADGEFRKRKAAPLLVEAKVAALYRSQVFPAMVGDAILRFGHIAPDKDLLLAFLMRRMSDKARIDIAEYADRFRQDLSWFIIDEAGQGYARLQGESEEISVEPLAPAGRPQGRGAPNRSMFSLNNQWLLKVLLLHGMDRKHWGGPQDGPESIVDLARIAKVPQPSVSKFVSRFEEAGFLHRVQGRLVVRRHLELLNDWYHADKHSRLRAVGVRPMYGDEPEDRLLKRIKEHCRPSIAAGAIPPVAVSHHLGCHLLGVGRSNVRAVHLHASQPVEDVLSSLDLVRDDSESPRMSVRWARASVAVFGGAVLANGVPVCDILQCYLDVRSSRARGEEQAQYILDSILLPHFKRRA